MSNFNDSWTDDEDVSFTAYRKRGTQPISSDESDEEDNSIKSYESDEIIQETDTSSNQNNEASSFLRNVSKPRENSSINSEENDGIYEASFQQNASKSHENSSVNSDDNDGIYEASFQSSSAAQKSDDSVELIPENRSTIEINDSDEDGDKSTELAASLPRPNLTQPTLSSFLTKPETKPQLHNATKTRKVPPAEFQAQLKRVELLEQQLMQTKKAMAGIRLETLPDKGALLHKKEAALRDMVTSARNVLENMEVSHNPQSAYDKVQVAWESLEAGVGAVVPKHFGKKGMSNFNAQKHMTIEALGQLHKSLESCPQEGDLAEDPEGLKVALMPHQKHALAWLLWRERQKPSGGILADDMGLGKTLTMISLVIKSLEMKQEDDSQEKLRGKYQGGTLVVCPASLLNQWSGEVERRTKRGLISVEQYHGAKRETNARRLSEYDLVITTYAIIMNEMNAKAAASRVRWRRIILDEAHQIRNHKARTSEAVCELSASSRWALTGTPIHNKEQDMFALLKFLRCTPFDDLQVWKHWMHDKSTGGQERLNTVISSIMLRRTKVELMAKGSLESLPERKWELVPVKLDAEEQDVYQRILIFSRTLFAQFLHQRAEKKQDAYDMNYKQAGPPPEANAEYFKVRNKLLKMNNVREVSQHEILVLLLRLRQICCHPSLIVKMLDGHEDLGEEPDENEDVNLLDQLNKLNLNESVEYGEGDGAAATNIKEASKGFLNPSQPVFDEARRSSKVKVLIKLLREKVVGTRDKAIVISQWTSLLRLIANELDNEKIKYDELNGSVPVHKRMVLVDNFNDAKHPMKVLLLSLTAGGVGLNLVGANHLFLMDLHWNPQLENQAQDRIYRMGQTKPIFVYKFMAVDTIEERIKQLQDNKLQIAEAMLTGSKQVVQSKLSLQDLKMLFDFK